MSVVKHDFPKLKWSVFDKKRKCFTGFIEKNNVELRVATIYKNEDSEFYVSVFDLDVEVSEDYFGLNKINKAKQKSQEKFERFLIKIKTFYDIFLK